MINFDQEQPYIYNYIYIHQLQCTVTTTIPGICRTSCHRAGDFKIPSSQERGAQTRRSWKIGLEESCLDFKARCVETGDKHGCKEANLSDAWCLWLRPGLSWQVPWYGEMTCTRGWAPVQRFPQLQASICRYLARGLLIMFDDRTLFFGSENVVMPSDGHQTVGNMRCCSDLRSLSLWRICGGRKRGTFH